MKKTYKFLSVAVLTAAATALCTSCSTDELAEQQQNETKAVSLTATLNEAQTRAGMSKGSDENTASFYWHNKDAILVQTVKTSDNTYPSTMFVTTDETGETKATFWGDALSGVTLGTYAVYPYNKKHAFTSETALTYNLPASYTYATVDNGIFSKTADGVTTHRTNSTYIPMYGKITDGNVAFQYLGGLAVIRIDRMPYTSGTLTVTADQKLSGDFSVDLSAATPEMATASTETDSEKQVTFTFSDATKGGVGVFYLPVATGKYTNLKINMYSDAADATSVTATYGSLNVERAVITAIPVYEGTDGSYSCTYEVDGHKFIDLCLPSGTLWAETNVGATSAADYGNYYAWGETETKTTYTIGNYDTGNTLSTTYTTEGQTLAAEHDAAYMNWGSFCRMPTYAETKELQDNCTWTWTTNGYQVTSNKNGNSIFLPAGGYMQNSTTDLGDACHYWSSTLDESSHALILYQAKNASVYGTIASARYFGLPVRPVAKPFGYELDNGGNVDDVEMNEFDDSWK